MKRVRYNIETEKAFIHGVITKQGEGILWLKEAKMNPDKSFYMRDARILPPATMTENPHFYLNLSRAKVTNEDVVTGPPGLVVADVPLFPSYCPSRSSPFTKSYSSSGYHHAKLRRRDDPWILLAKRGLLLRVKRLQF